MVKKGALRSSLLISRKTSSASTNISSFCIKELRYFEEALGSSKSLSKAVSYLARSCIIERKLLFANINVNSLVFPKHFGKSLFFQQRLVQCFFYCPLFLHCSYMTHASVRCVELSWLRIRCDKCLQSFKPVVLQGF